MLRPGVAFSPAKVLAERYQTTVETFYTWARMASFPRGEGGTRKKVYPDLEVEAWVKAHRPLVWAALIQSTEPFSSGGDPDDLLNIEEFATIRGKRYGREPVPASTMRSYLTNGWIPRPDRTPDDGLSPSVPVRMWYRRTVDSHVGSMKGPGNRNGAPRGSTGAAKDDAAR